MERYLASERAARKVDTRLCIVMLAFYSVTIFFVDTWAGLLFYAGGFAVSMAAFRASPGAVFKIAVPIYAIAMVTVILNMFAVADGRVLFSWEGLARGCFFAARILLLVWTSLVVCLTSTPTALTSAFSSMLSPLGRLGLPTNDIATVFSVALRFIPLTVAEFFAIKDAQWSRGAHFDEGGAMTRVRSYASIFAPMLVAMFRRADSLSVAMDARCYSRPGIRPADIRKSRLRPTSAAICVAVCAACVAAAIFL